MSLRIHHGAVFILYAPNTGPVFRAFFLSSPNSTPHILIPVHFFSQRGYFHYKTNKTQCGFPPTVREIGEAMGLKSTLVIKMIKESKHNFASIRIYTT
ncbi:MAG TPA: hypothetical protein DEF85_03750 [Clostridiaceae bacterium]|nr:hypothetical protein [Clostridiaceae bacterium]HBF78339.1 hypothetical protein [Clostridiaceae bacterium]HBN29044.1 hypothetical protein [Clostridiaceae bacterium]HBX47987.1 hypothetical protein [Clostridiaceae bacterium]HCL50083.1 hypothetical protein [Clostridiaceae bacterium]